MITNNKFFEKEGNSSPVFSAFVFADRLLRVFDLGAFAFPPVSMGFNICRCNIIS